MLFHYIVRFLFATVQGKRPTFAELEAELLNGQKLQGVLTSDEVQDVLEDRGWEQLYPLFTTVNRIVNDAVPVTRLFEYKAVAKEPFGGNGDDPFGVAAALESAALGTEAKAGTSV
jgi:glycerol-3-phosphate dehydrogenase (NAD+)